MKINNVIAFITLFLSLNNYASYIDKNGEAVIGWFSVDDALMIEEIDPLRLKFTDDYFHNWFYTYMYKNKVKKKSFTRIHKRFKDFFTDFDDQSEDCAVPSLCEMIKEVGIERTIKMVYLYEVYGINTTHFKKVEYILEYVGTYEPFTNKELLSLIIASELFKQNFHYISQEKLMMTYSNYKKTNASANALITFFNRWRNSNFYDKVATVLHELYHQLDGLHFYNQADMKGIMLGSDKEWKEIVDTCFVSKYANTNFAEDASESLLAYFHNKAYLDQVCPEKSKVIKRVLEEAKIEQNKTRNSLKYKLNHAIRSFFY